MGGKRRRGFYAGGRGGEAVRLLASHQAEDLGAELLRI